MKSIILSASLWICFISLVNAQEFYGKVVTQYNLPIPDAFIQVIRTGEHTHSTSNGDFMLVGVKVGDSLTISCAGFDPKLVSIENLENMPSIRLDEKNYSLSEVVIVSNLKSIEVLSDIKLQTDGVNSAQDLLRLVPGLFIGQHAGGGKAEQMFLRGFDIDHGTDIAISVDGMPVNMVSHAHGQGYADLHFLIPETIQKIQFGKGPYQADQGNFATAGYVAFNTFERLNNSQIKIEAGQFNTQRLLGMFNLANTTKSAAWIAGEYLQSDGPFRSPQNFDRVNIIGKYVGELKSGDRFSFQASHFTSDWNASGQIPQRAVDAGLIDRFGAIDDTEGGKTSRTNVQGSYTKSLGSSSILHSTAYFSNYTFDLFSNFTFFLEDPVNGDQIRQKENRQLFGFQSVLNHGLSLGSFDGLIKGGVGLRNDKSNGNELAHTLNRSTTLFSIQRGDIHETNAFAFASSQFDLNRFSLELALRYDHFQFRYIDLLATSFEQASEQKGFLSPKVNLTYTVSDALQVYGQYGRGFHSNDTRGVVTSPGLPTLPAANGVDLGLLWKVFPNLLIQTAVWNLDLEQEFVYVGDAGIVEPGTPAKRQGIDFSVRYQPISWLYADFDLNLTKGRALEVEAGEDHIPLAALFTYVGGIQIENLSGFSGGIRLRHLGDRPANEDNSIIAKGYTIVDASIGYAWKQLEFGVQIQNLFNTEWNETQFATESRLQNEIEPVEEIHFTPGTPFFLKGSVAFKF